MASGKVDKDPRKILEAAGEEALQEMARLTPMAVEVMKEGVAPGASEHLPYSERRAAAKYLLDYGLPQSPSKSASDSMTIQLLNADQQSMMVFVKSADKLERIPHEMAEVPDVEHDPHLIPAETREGEEEPG